MDELRKKRVMLISPDFGFGGAEKAIANLSSLLAGRYQIFFVVFNSKTAQAYDVAGSIHSLEVRGSVSWPAKVFGLWKRIRRLRSLKKELHPDVSISFLEGGDYVNVLSRVNERIITSLRGSKKFDRNIRGVSGFFRHRMMIPWVYRRTDEIVAVDRAILRELADVYRISKARQGRVIPNFVDVGKIRKMACEQLTERWVAFFGSRRALVACGRLSREKGFDMLLTVFSQFRREERSAALVIIGDGELHGELATLCERLALNVSLGDPTPGCDVVLAGYRPNPFPIIALADAFLLSSLNEGFPNVLLEAMTLGVPVVASDCPYGPSSILGRETDRRYRREYGILLPMLSTDQNLSIWVKELGAVVNDAELMRDLRNKSLERASYYTAERAFRLWQEVIEDETAHTDHR